MGAARRRDGMSWGACAVGFAILFGGATARHSSCGGPRGVQKLSSPVRGRVAVRLHAVPQDIAGLRRTPCLARRPHPATYVVRPCFSAGANPGQPAVFDSVGIVFHPGVFARVQSSCGGRVQISGRVQIVSLAETTIDPEAIARTEDGSLAMQLTTHGFDAWPLPGYAPHQLRVDCALDSYETAAQLEDSEGTVIARWTQVIADEDHLREPLWRLCHHWRPVGFQFGAMPGSPLCVAPRRSGFVGGPAPCCGVEPKPHNCKNPRRRGFAGCGHNRT